MMRKKNKNGAVLGVKNQLCHLGWPMNRTDGSSTSRGCCCCCSCSGCTVSGCGCCCYKDTWRMSGHQVLPSLLADSWVTQRSSGAV
jgi:hypothetical protein